MAYDDDLANRIRELLADGPPITEQAMFGGLAFLLDGRITVAASSQGGLLVRADPDQTAHLLATTDAEPMRMRGREIRGWLHVDAAHLRTRRQLARWIGVGRAGAEKATR